MLSKTLAGTLGAGLLALGVATSAAPAQAATFTVNTTDNGGPGSLRSAILAAEDTLRRDRIEFAIPGNGVHTIALDTDLPVLTRPLTIKGYSQNGSSPATGTTAAAPKIVIDAANALRGLDVGGDEMEIRGLVVKNAEAAGIFVEGRENVIAGNHVGTNAAGTAARGNGGDGITVVGRDNVIGGSDPEDRNVISGNLGGEVAVTDGTGNVIEGNRIGTNAAGTAGFGGAVGVELESAGTTVRDNLISDHGFAGVTVTGDDNTLQGNDVGTKRSGKRALANGFGILVQGGDANLIGGTAEGEGNLVSGNLHAGIRLDRSDDDPAVGNDVQGNLIGTTSTGRAPLPNGAFGGYPGVSVVASNANTIGGSAPGAGNVISANAGDGVYLRDGADDNQVLGNAIGTNRTGRRELGNGGSGVFIADGDANRVGDDQDGTPRQHDHPQRRRRRDRRGRRRQRGRPQRDLRQRRPRDRPGRRRLDRERPVRPRRRRQRPPERPGDRRGDAHDGRVGARDAAADAVPARVLHLRRPRDRRGPDVPRLDPHDDRRERRRRRDHAAPRPRAARAARHDDGHPGGVDGVARHVRVRPLRGGGVLISPRRGSASC